jgi:uncharacterized protein with GYD domain
MAHYLFQTAYTSEGVATLVKNPQDRFELVRPAIEAMGGKLVCGYFAFGEYDVVGIMEMPDNVSAAAFSISVSSKGGLKAFKTTPLMTMAEAQSAMTRAGTSTYEPPK